MNQEPSSSENTQREIAEDIGARIAKAIGTGIAAVIGMIVVGFVLAWLIQFLWNQTLVAMFAWPSIGYWQAFALFLLAKIFFGFGSSGRAMPQKSPGDHNQHSRAHKWGHHRALSKPNEGPNTSDDDFKKYWQEEGKAAFEDFLSKKNSRQSADK